MKYRKVQPKMKHIIESLQYYSTPAGSIAIEWYLCGRHWDRGSGPKLIGDKRCKRCLAISKGM